MAEKKNTGSPAPAQPEQETISMLGIEVDIATGKTVADYGVEEMELPDIDAVLGSLEEARRAKSEEERSRRRREREGRNEKIRSDHPDLFERVEELELKGLRILEQSGWRDHAPAVEALAAIRRAHKAIVDDVEGVGLVLYDETIATMNEVEEGDVHAFEHACNLALLRGNLVTGSAITEPIRKKGLVWVHRASFGWPGEPKALMSATRSARRRALPKITPQDVIDGNSGRCEFHAVQEFASGKTEADVVLEVWDGETVVVSAGDLTGFLRNPEKGAARLRYLLKEASAEKRATGKRAGLAPKPKSSAKLDFAEPRPGQSGREISPERRVSMGLPPRRAPEPEERSRGKGSGRPEARRGANALRRQVATDLTHEERIGAGRRKATNPTTLREVPLERSSGSLGTVEENLDGETANKLKCLFAEPIHASPAARKRAEELGVDLSTVTPTGRAGITVKDVDAAARAAASEK